MIEKFDQGCATPFTLKKPPPGVSSQNLYRVIASPSASVTLNSDDISTAWLASTELFDALTTGAWFTVDIVKVLNAPGSVASNACTHRVSEPFVAPPT